MHSRTAALTAVFLTTAAWATPATDGLSDVTAGEPVTTYNLAIIPLETHRPPPYDDYAVLEEATAAKTVRIQEMGQGGEVNSLTVANRGPLPLYLLGGEVVLGGQQDRMLQSDTVVEAGKRHVVPVMCVEHGRWNGNDLTFRSSGEVAHPDLRRLASFEGQGAVWNEVARKSQATGVHSDTGTFRRVLQDNRTRERIRRYVDELEEKLPPSEHRAGFAVAINGELVTVDVFDSPKLLAKLERKLLSSYVLAALERQAMPESVVRAKLGRIGTKQVQDFIAPPTGLEAKSAGRVYQSKGKAVHSASFAK